MLSISNENANSYNFFFRLCYAVYFRARKCQWFVPWRVNIVAAPLRPTLTSPLLEKLLAIPLPHISIREAWQRNSFGTG